MKFAATLLSLAGSAAVASAASVTFVTLDNLERTVYFTSNENAHPMEPVKVSSKKDTRVEFADNYVGNFYSVIDGEENAPGMLGEVKFGGWNGLTYFDVSGIINLNDKNNVKEMWPAQSQQPTSGCKVFPCDNIYILPDDIQTKATEEVDLITTLGGSS